MPEALPDTIGPFMAWTWEQIAPHFEALQRVDLNAANVQDWLAGWTRLSDLLSERYARLNTAVTVDTTDAAAEQAYNTFIDQVRPQAQAAEQQLKQKLLAGGLEPAGFEAPLRKMRAEAALFRAENLPLLAQENKLSSEYNKIIGAQTVEWDGDELTIQQLRRYLHHPERRVRERAWRLAAERQLSDRPAINELWRRFTGLRRTLAANAGFSGYRDFRWQQMLRLDYTPQDAQRFDQAVEQVVVPAATRLYRRYAQRLGAPSVRPWDLDNDLIPLSHPPLPPYGALEDLPRKAEAAFRRVDAQFGEQFGQMRVEGLLDLDNHKGKAPGAYCTSYPVTGRPFVFMNAIGLSSDVRTILHESGHAFHNYARLRLPFAQQRTPGLEFAEVASMAMELLASPYLDVEPEAFYAPEAARRFRIAHLEQALTFWPYMAVVDSFQHWVYTHPEQAGEAAYCDAKWLELWWRYLPGVDWTGLEEAAMTGWQRKQHIHRYPFYYIEYGLAQLGAVQVWANARRDPQAALAQYRHALELGGTVTLPELYAAAGARLAFDAGTLAEAVTLAEQVINELEMQAV
ncbi:MAG: M3 family oligoendopeptidase [Chloroflexota bacterium]